MNSDGLPTRILMIPDTVGGVWTYTLELARALEARGVELTLATMGGLLSEAQRAEWRALSNVELFESDWKLEWMDEPWDDLQRAGEWLLEIEATTAPDCIHCNGYVHAALPWNAPCIAVGHSCVLSWWEAVRREPIPESLGRYREAVARGLRAARAIVTPTRAMRAALLRHYDPPAEVRVIANGVAPDAFHAAEKLPYLMAAGRLWDEGKNVGALARVAPELEWPVVIAGEACAPDGRQVSYAGVRELGAVPRDEVGEWLARASIYALPARYEPFGLSVLEAALSRCALVLGDTDSLRENWHDAAVFVDPDDDREIERMLAYLIATPERRAELAQAAAERARGFGVDAMAAAYTDLYTRTIAAERGARAERAACTS
jgi:glycosyltransferase involved in cell wall biosynthesis